MDASEPYDVPSPWIPIAVVLAISVAVDVGLDLAWIVAGYLEPSTVLFAQVALWWTAWLVLAPALYAVAARSRPERIGWTPVIAAHVLLGVAVAALQALLAGLLFTIPGVAEETSPWAIALNLFERFGVASFAIYLAAVGASLVYRDFHRAQSARLSALAAEQRAAELEAELAASDFDEASSGLRPEFISSAFAGVADLIREGRSDDAVRSIARLGDRLRT